jgi:hypothetical protein
MCVHFDALKKLVVDSKGFEFVEEGARKKKGFVGLKPGAVLGYLWCLVNLFAICSFIASSKLLQTHLLGNVPILPSAGDHVSFGLDTLRNPNLTLEQLDKGEGEQVLVQLAHLKSYEHMGVAVARSD